MQELPFFDDEPSLPDENLFTHRRHRGEFDAITGSVHGQAYFADSYPGWSD